MNRARVRAGFDPLRRRRDAFLFRHHRERAGVGPGQRRGARAAVRVALAGGARQAAQAPEAARQTRDALGGCLERGGSLFSPARKRRVTRATREWFRLREVADSGRSRVRERRGGFLSLRERRTRDCFKTRRTRHRGTTVPGGVRGLSHLVLSSVAHRWTFRELSELEWDPAPSHARARFRLFWIPPIFGAKVQRPVRARGDHAPAGRPAAQD